MGVRSCLFLSCETDPVIHALERCGEFLLLTRQLLYHAVLTKVRRAQVLVETGAALCLELLLGDSQGRIIPAERSELYVGPNECTYNSASSRRLRKSLSCSMYCTCWPWDLDDSAVAASKALCRSAGGCQSTRMQLTHKLYSPTRLSSLSLSRFQPDELCNSSSNCIRSSSSLALSKRLASLYLSMSARCAAKSSDNFDNSATKAS